MIALGSLSQLFNIPQVALHEVIASKFARKGDDVVHANLAAFERGRELAAMLKKPKPGRSARPPQSAMLWCSPATTPLA